MMDSDKGSVHEANNIENPAKRPRLAITEPSTQSCDKNDFSSSDTEFLSKELRKRVQQNVLTFYGRIREFFVNDKFTDVNIKCENQIFGCHRLILAATCEYFEVMFSGNFRENYAEEITLHDISIATFKEILTFAYKGHIKINDDNVLELLYASNLFGLTFIENECTRYLLEERIPIEQALEIFIFARNVHKTILIPVVSQFILEHLDHISRSVEYLEIVFDDVCCLLANFRALSLHDDQIILNAVYQWVFHSGRNPKDKKTLFDGLVQRVQQWYQYDPVKDSYSLFMDCESVDDAAVDTTDPINAKSIHQLPIHVYVNTSTETVDATGILKYHQLDIFTSKFEKDDNDIDWFHSSSIATNNIIRMRTVVIDKQLYCLCKDDEAPTFSVSSSADLCLNKLSLKIPPCLSASHYSSNNLLCCDKRTRQIYSFNSTNFEPNPYLFLYDRELDEWTSIPLLYASSNVGNCMTCHDDGRLYLFTGVSGNRFVRAYDHRDGKWSALTKYSRKKSITADECCSFKGKIFVSCYSVQKKNALEIFDSRSNKWLNSVEWKTKGSHEECGAHRLVPYGDRLWMFSNCKCCLQHIVAKQYNLFQQKCSSMANLNEVITQKLRNLSPDKTSYLARLKDVVAFNPS